MGFSSAKKYSPTHRSARLLSSFQSECKPEKRVLLICWWIKSQKIHRKYSEQQMNTLLVYFHTRWHYYDMICLYPWLCPSSRSSVASVYMKFQKSNLPHCYCHNHLEKVDVSHFTCDVPKRMV